MTSESRIEPKAMELLRSLEADSPGSVRELVRLFVTDAPGQLLRIEEGCRQRDAEKVRQAAHFIRSGAMALGLTASAEASHAVERMPEQDYGTDKSEWQVMSLRAELADARAALLAAIEEL